MRILVCGGRDCENEDYVEKNPLKPTRNPNIAAKTNAHHGLPECR